MTEEIKEILIKDFNEILVKEFCTDWKEKRLYIELLVNSTSFSNLLNYITNLQKENTDFKKLCNKYEEEHNTAFKLWKANMEKIPPFDKILDYKSRNKKAIEYIEKYLQEHIIDDLPDEESKFELENGTPIPNAKEILLNILQGGDE